MVDGRRGDGQGVFWGDLVGPNPSDRRERGEVEPFGRGRGGRLSVIVDEANARDDKLLAAPLTGAVEQLIPTEETLSICA